MQQLLALTNLDSNTQAWWELTLRASRERALANYREALRLGIPSEVASALLPGALPCEKE